jgi:hypothetical protein
MGSKSSEAMASDALLLGHTTYEVIYEPAATDEKNA